MANKRFIDFPIATTVGDNDIILIWQSGANKQTTKATILSGVPDSLNDLTDVTISGLTNGQILRYDSVSGQWENTDQGNLDLNDLNDVTIVSPTNGQVLVYNSTTSKWENSSAGFVPYVGAVTTVDLGLQGLEAGYVRFDTSIVSVPNNQGTMYWDASKSTVALIMNGTLQHIGQDSFFYCKNSTGSPIPKGTSVRFAGTDGASGHILITPFLANGSVPSNYFIGVTAEAISNGSFGQVMHFGELDGINTSTYTAGALLYASTTVAGGFQTTAPVAPNNIVLVAAAVNSKNNGSIVVRPTYGSNINTDEGVKITSPTTGDLLQLQAGGLWENKTKAQVLGGTSAQFVKGDGSLDSTLYVPTTRTITINGTSQDLSANRTFNVGTVTSVSALTLGTTGTDLSSTVANGTTTPVITLNVPTASATNRGALSSADWSMFNTKQNALTLTTTGSSGAATLVGATLNIPNYGSALSGYLPLTGGALTGPLTSSSNAIFKTASGFALKLDSSSSSEENDLRFSKGGVDFGAIQTHGTTGDFEFYVNIDGTGGGYYRSIILKRDSTKIDFLISDSINTTINSSGLTSVAFIKTGGTSAQFLKANGSVDSTTYVSNVTASSPLFSSGGATPNITIQQASGSQSGFLSSTDWTTFNSKQNALTNPVTGTGTAGQVAYFTGTSAISSESNLFWDATNDRLGIGLSNPSQPLEVLKSQNGDSAIQVTNTNSGNAATAQFFADNGTTRTQFFHTGTSYGTLGVLEANQGGIFNSTSAGIALVAFGASGILRFATGGTTTRLTISSTGAATFSSSVTTRNATTSASVNPSVMGAGEMMSTGSQAGYFWENRSGGVTFNSNWYGWYTASGIVHLYNGSSNLLSINGTSGAATFSSSVTAAQFIVGSATTSSDVSVRYKTDTGDFSTINERNTHSFGIYDNQVSLYRLYINSSGNVGIGDSNPLQKLIVNGGSLLVNSGTSATAFRDIMMGGIGGWSTNESHGIDTVYNTAGSPTTFSRIESHFDGVSGRFRFRNLFFSSAPRTDILMTIEGNGNVLIGTTTDNGSKLRVNGSVFVNENTEIDSKTTTGVGFTAVPIANLSGLEGSTYYITAVNGANYYRLTVIQVQNTIIRSEEIKLGTIPGSSLVIVSGILNMQITSGTWTVKCTQIRTV